MTPTRKPTRRPSRKPSRAGKGEAALRLLKALRERYPDAHCELSWSAPHELLIATILSAQCTDVAVNKATPALFKRFASPAAYAASTPAAIEPFVQTLGFFRQKAKSVHASMTALVRDFGGEVPRTMDDLITLRGVARKTANVVLGNAFGLNEGVVVDTHVQRLTQRFGLTKHTDPVKIERDLMALFPRESWCVLSHLLIFHGRRVCKARGHDCADDPLCRAFASQSSSRFAQKKHALKHPSTAPARRSRGDRSHSSTDA
ncbi:MAG: endonuclease III [Phycisphaerae bacterium]|nr:endonuclease III [Phycisphaerae bacterium]MDZ4831355.1 endonuclease III [Phycisphaerae bacterium]